MEPTPNPNPEPAAERAARRLSDSLHERGNWEQLGKFCTVGAVGYGVNLAAFAFFLDGLDLHYIAAAIGSFLVAVGNNFALNRAWTFRTERGSITGQGLRFLVVSTAALGANLVALHLFVRAGVAELVAQAIAIALVTPVNFVGNKLWSFRVSARRTSRRGRQLSRDGRAHWP